MKLNFNNSGMSLIEVLLAVSILSFGTLGVLRAYGTALEALDISKTTVNSVLLLKNIMSEVEEKSIVEAGLSPSETSGSFDGEFNDFQWEVKVSSGKADNINQVDAVVYRGGSSRKFFLSTQFINPDPVEAKKSVLE